MTATQAAEDVTATNHNAYLYAHLRHFLDLLGILTKPFGVDAEALFAHQALTTELQEYSFKSCHDIIVLSE